MLALGGTGGNFASTASHPGQAEQRQALGQGGQSIVSRQQARLRLSLMAVRFFLEQRLGIRMHAGALLGYGMLRSIFLLRQPFDPPDLREKLADLFHYVPAILLSHGSCGFVGSSNATS